MSEIAKKLVNKLGPKAMGSLSDLVLQVQTETGQNENEASLDVARRIAEYRQQHPTAYERVLLDVANGRPRPKNFDASGP